VTIENETAARGYQLPAPSNKLSEDVNRLIAAVTQIDADMAAALLAIAGKANTVHLHVIADVAGLSAALDGKAAVGHTHTLPSLTGVSVTAVTDGQALIYSGGQWVNASLGIGNVAGLAAALASLQAQIDEIDGGTF
jgi:hypothetical protein